VVGGLQLQLLVGVFGVLNGKSLPRAVTVLVEFNIVVIQPAVFLNAVLVSAQNAATSSTARNITPFAQQPCFS
jgi:hypothetical protein